MDDREAIEQLKARYFRTMDTKDWEAMRRLFTDDAVLDFGEDRRGVHASADDFMAFLTRVLDGTVTVHHGHTPEIDLTSPTTATGVWAMTDLVSSPEGRELRGHGHYHDTYEKIDGRWLIASSKLTRLRIEITTASG